MIEQKASIRSRISLHDRSQVEIAFSYLFGEESKSESSKDRRVYGPYNVDAYFFFPAQMRIDAESYPKEKFYQDLKTFVRLREPRLSYKNLIGIGIQPSGSPISYVRRHVEMLAIGSQVSNVEMLVDEIRLFACSFSSYVFRRSERRKKKISKILNELNAKSTSSEYESALKAVRAVDKFIQRGFHLLHAWREVLGAVSKIDSDTARQIKQEMLFVDEYCSYAFRDSLISLLGQFQKLTPRYGKEVITDTHSRLLAALRLERWYSRKLGFFWVEFNSSPEYQERFVTRRSALKRRVWSVLYLDARTKPLFTIQRQTGAIISAGLAGAWAVLAEIIIRQRGFVPGGVGFTNLGVSGFLFITALIMAYILKDRIKEVGRSYFQFRTFFGIPDNSNVINFKSTDGEDLQVALVKEEVNFVKKEKLPKDILKLRERKSEEHVEPEELYRNILHYQKSIQMNKNVILNLPQPVQALHDILRLSISSYLARLDESLHQGYVLDQQNNVRELTMPKVYHLDIVLKYSRKSEDNVEFDPVYDYIRLYVNKEGLSRIQRGQTKLIS